ncbi:hypothetical protein HOI71_20235 [Candidatus Poribacteria bacterium]|nr:hypothetical protein [Candidatus Poribacteria bacterium]
MGPYVFGGNGLPLDDLASVVGRYDPVTGAWTRLSDMPVGRIGHRAEVIDVRIYIVGDGQRVDRYDPVADAWSRAKGTPTAGPFATAVVDDRLYTFGGPFEWDHAQEYDPGSDRWSERSPTPIGPLGAPSSSLTESTQSAAAASPGPRTNSFAGQLIYDPARDTWQAGPSTDSPHDQAAAGALGVIHAIDGQALLGPPQAASRTVEAWDTGIRARWPARAPRTRRGPPEASIRRGGALMVTPGGGRGDAAVRTFPPRPSLWERTRGRRATGCRVAARYCSLLGVPDGPGACRRCQDDE